MAAYSLARWKVVWRDMGSEIQVAVVGQTDGRTICPEHHVMFVPLTSAGEAHYLCALLMSSPVQLLVSGYTTTTGISTHVLEHVAAPTFEASNPVHETLTRLSEQCHTVAIENDGSRLVSLEKEVDETAARLWGITSGELKSIQKALAEAGGNRNYEAKEEVDE